MGRAGRRGSAEWVIDMPSSNHAGIGLHCTACTVGARKPSPPPSPPPSHSPARRSAALSLPCTCLRRLALRVLPPRRRLQPLLLPLLEARLPLLLTSLVLEPHCTTHTGREQGEPRGHCQCRWDSSLSIPASRRQACMRALKQAGHIPPLLPPGARQPSVKGGWGRRAADWLTDLCQGRLLKG